jgi:phage gp29-like protein
MQGYCNDATQTLQQLAEMVVRLNWGETSEMPTVVCEIPAPEDAVKNAQRDEILLRMGLSIPEKFLRQRHDVPAPSEDEAIVSAPKATAVPALTAALSAAKTAKDDKLAEAIERLLVAAINEGNAEFIEQTEEKEAA